MSSITELSTNYGNQLFGSDSEWSRGLGSLFAQASSAALGTMGSNLYKGQALFEGVGQDAGQSLAGTGVGLLSNWAGRGITSAMGDSRLGRGVGAGAATALGTIGGQAVSNLFSNGSVLTSFADGGTGFFGTGGNWFKQGAGTINPYALGAQVLGTALGAATGPSKEYEGKYGNITRTMDSIYDAATAGANFIPGVGQGISAMMTLNKGLSNIFGSTSGMTKTDAILGSAFMPASVKWLNMAGAKTTDKFENQSWQNQEKAGKFMQNAFGDLDEKFNKARAESNKTYGTFSRGAYKRANRNIAFANNAWDQIMNMADERELEDIRSQYMSSINNQRYAQMVNGGFRPLAFGKQGMKIFNNQINHNIGQRLLSGAALIDDKQMILSFGPGGSTATTLYNKSK